MKWNSLAVVPRPSRRSEAQDLPINQDCPAGRNRADFGMSKFTQKSGLVRGSASGVTEIRPLPDKPVGSNKAFDTREFPDARTGGTASRTEIRETTRRVMGSRQSAKAVERSGQRRQPKTGGTGGHGKKRAD